MSRPWPRPFLFNNRNPWSRPWTDSRKTLAIGVTGCVAHLIAENRQPKRECHGQSCIGLTNAATIMTLSFLVHDIKLRLVIISLVMSRMSEDLLWVPAAFSWLSTRPCPLADHITSLIGTLLHYDKSHFAYHVPSQPWRAVYSCRMHGVSLSIHGVKVNKKPSCR